MKIFRGLAMGLTMTGFMAARAQAGNLEPPGIPAPTMKTLDQGEPCKLIWAHGFTIDAPGSYCLTNDLNAEDDEKDGIVINAGNVTLDLRGFTIRGRIGGTARGVFSDQNLPGVVIRNGTIGGWAGDGISLSLATDSRLENLRVLRNSGSGIVVGVRNQITDCLIQGNLGSRGIEVGARASILRSTITGNSNGIVVNGGSATISDSTVVANLGGGIVGATDSMIRGCHIASNSGDGISQPDGSLIVDSTVVDNGGSGISFSSDLTISRCTIHGNAQFGIHDAARMKISDCTVSNNSLGGMRVNGSGYVLNNNVVNNGGGIGILLGSTGSRVEGNNLTGQGCAIYSDGGNLFIRNSARGNAGCFGGPELNYKFGAGDLFGTIVSTNATLNAASNALVNISLP